MLAYLFLVSPGRLLQAALEPLSGSRPIGEDHACEAAVLSSGPGSRETLRTLLAASSSATTAASGEENEAFPYGAI